MKRIEVKRVDTGREGTVFRYTDRSGKHQRQYTGKHTNNRIEEARVALGLSRQDLADKAGVHYQTIGYLEREEYSPSLVLALRIAKSLNQEVSELFSQTPFKKGK